MVVLSEPSPGSSSSSSSTPLYAYDVFLSFRGVDTRHNFTDQLYHALVNGNIVTFMDDAEIETGDPLKPELESAIKSSRASIIIFSENYASSTWCLDELVLILEQKKSFKQTVIPIFYDVDPSDVRKQQNSFGEAMAEHKQRMDTEKDAEKKSQLAQKIESWKRALTEVANSAGTRIDARLEWRVINELVELIHNRVKSHTLPFLLGMEVNIKFIGAWLTDGSNHTADMLSIVGMGGIGKTTLARYVFQVYSREFDRSSFIEGINRRCNEHFNGLRDLQMQLHRNISKNIKLQVDDAFEYTSKLESALARKRVFIVLDDIGSLDQLNGLLGKHGLHPGSKVIITTKEASLTEKCTLFKSQAHPYGKEVALTGLNESQSLDLLCFHAFKEDRNPKNGYEDVAQKLVKYCEGHPLALKVLGTSLHKEDVAIWEDYIEVLKKEPHAHINNALKLSFDSLSSKNDKELFKHIACFFVGADRYVTQTILNACDIKTRSGITHLISKCLLYIGSNKELMMHQLIQEMGKYVVCQESPDKPWKRTRLCCHEESLKVLKQKKGTSSLLGVALDMSKLDKKKLYGSLELKRESFCQMDNLKLLQLNYVQLNDCFEGFEELRWLCMHGFSEKSLHLDLPMENLVALDMSYSKIESFDVCNPQSPAKKQKVSGSCSKHKRLLGSLKILDLSFCKQLHSLGGFFELPVLERLIVRNCISLVEVCESLNECVELILIDRSYCQKLRKFPSLDKLEKLETLLLDGCNPLGSQVKMWNMNSSDNSINSLGSSSVPPIPSDIKFFTISFPRSLTTLSLANNNLFNESFPMDLSRLNMLEELCLDDNPIVSMPNCVRTLPRLEQLSMRNCEKVISIEKPPRTLRELSVFVDPNRGFKRDVKTCLRTVTFDPEMSPLNLIGVKSLFVHPSFEIDGIIKIQALEDVEEKVLHSLGWTSLEFIKDKHLRISGVSNEPAQTQMYYEFGIFSTIFYERWMMPDGISHTRKGSSISFIIPPSPNNFRGLNFYCTVETTTLNLSFDLPLIKINNFTKSLIWVYDHCIDTKEFGGKCISLLSHWVFGPNEMKGGDKINVTVATRNYEEQVTECGIGFVHDEDGDIAEEKKDEHVLGYYKSWNHIIGGDLSGFQLSTGEYILHNKQFWRSSHVNDFDYTPFVDSQTGYKEDRVVFKAFSQEKKKCGGTSHVVIEELE